MLYTLKLMALNLLIRLAKFRVMHENLTLRTPKELDNDLDLFIDVSKRLNTIPTDALSNRQRMYLLTIMYNTNVIKSALIKECMRRIDALETLLNMTK